MTKVQNKKQIEFIIKGKQGKRKEIAKTMKIKTSEHNLKNDSMTSRIEATFNETKYKKTTANASKAKFPM